MEPYLILTWLYLLGLFCCITSSKKSVVHLSAFVPILNSDFFNYRAAIDTAVNYINNDQSILKNHELNITYYKEDWVSCRNQASDI